MTLANAARNATENKEGNCKKAKVLFALEQVLIYENDEFLWIRKVCVLTSLFDETCSDRVKQRISSA